MAYVDGFVIACPKARKQEFIDHASKADSAFIESGATRIFECWEDDVPDGKTTDFRMAVKAKDDEAVLFSWVEWPDKKTRDACMANMDEMMKDPRMDPDRNPMPFDGKRMIYGGFDLIAEEGRGGKSGANYVDGMVAPCPEGNKNDFIEHSRKINAFCIDNGATRAVDNWGDDVPKGKTTDFPMAVKAKDDEAVVFSWIEWPDKKTRDAAWSKMQGQSGGMPDMPFDGKRMINGGFSPVVTLNK
jgi:uncharacterized protein YbaA (DUF1428 family)